ncbi:MAG: hypothetical protein GX591_14140 [Planctomycetes bacterium]|nr:hypothetical protein [Planctomycetota bacterium]
MKLRIRATVAYRYDTIIDITDAEAKALARRILDGEVSRMGDLHLAVTDPHSRCGITGIAIGQVRDDGRLVELHRAGLGVLAYGEPDHD